MTYQIYINDSGGVSETTSLEKTMSKSCKSLKHQILHSEMMKCFTEDIPEDWSARVSQDSIALWDVSNKPL